MALTATATQGFEVVRHVSESEIMWVPGTPGVTYTKGDLVSQTTGEGVVGACAVTELPIGVVMKTVDCAAATVAFPLAHPGGSAGWGDVPGGALDSLVAIKPLVPVGTPVLKATFASQTDDAAITSYTPATPAMVVAAVAGDDDSNGGIVYCYTGPGKGEYSVIADTTASSNTLTLHRVFSSTLTTSSGVIYLPGAVADDGGIGFFGRLNNADANNLAVNDGQTDGNFTVFMDGREVSTYLQNLTLPVINSALMYVA